MSKREGREMTDRAESQEPQAAGASMESGEAASSLIPASGWHVFHLFYGIDRVLLGEAGGADRGAMRASWARLCDGSAAGPARRFQTFVVPGQKAQLGVILADPDPLKLVAWQASLEASALGRVLRPAYSFTSLTEVSEYVPDAEQYARILREREGMDPESTIYRTRVSQYASRLEGMNRQRLEPEFPDWPCLCFYPMNKLRTEGQNWYLLPFEERSRMMAEHGKSGMKFAGRVSQLITASTGLDDWEWGVTLWARNPQYLKEIVYTMRFDEASARYAAFGSFYQGYLMQPGPILETLQI
jgi:chlorite dismutase